MTALHKAAQQALDFCEFLWREVTLNDYAEELRHETEVQLIAALAKPEQEQEPAAWAGHDLDAMVEAFSRVIEAHHSSKHPFHDPINMDAQMALRILRGFIPAMKASTTSGHQELEPVAWMDIDEEGNRLSVRQWSDGNPQEVPLYTAPPSASR